VLVSLERGLTQSHEHQQMTMHVHEQYLSNQSDYANIFSQLMQQQGAIFAAGNTHPQQAEIAAQVLESLARSMTHFHNLQVETLNVHKQFLGQQSTYAQTYVQVIQQQQEALLHGNGNGNGSGKTSTQPSAISTQPPAVSYQPSAISVQPSTVSAQPSDEAQITATAEPAVTTVDTATLTDSLLAIVSEKTGYPAEMLDLELDMEADLSIDSIKRVEILGALQEEHPELPTIEADALTELRTLGQIIEYTRAQMLDQPSAVSAQPSAINVQPSAISVQPSDETQITATAETAATTVDTATLTDSLLDIVSEKTGYPAEMLELELDMEADLSIDSIKRVEILGALQEKHPELPTIEADALTELRTLGQIIAFMGSAEKKA
ncbi:MAG: phosphopantetheine-binding protein, partial [Chloroflexota bacterium]|nr:phosphopantetheine-binding protein [Chloroflexota bacterium]